MTNQDKKEILCQYGPLKRETERLMLEKDRWRSIAEKITPAYGATAQGGGGNRIVAAVEKLDEIDSLLSEKLSERVVIYQKAMALIDSVHDANLRYLLCLRYIDGKTWEEIAVDMGYSYRQTIRLHGAALSKIMA